MGFISEAADNDSNHDSKYIGQENRAIKSLSSEDIAELERGGGWGLAKAAELNWCAWTCASSGNEGRNSTQS